MYTPKPPGHILPVYEKGGMRFDLAITDPQADYETADQRRFQYLDAWPAPKENRAEYNIGFMFPDEFVETPNEFSIMTFKHKNSGVDHSAPVSLRVRDMEMHWNFRKKYREFDPDERQLGKIQIQRNMWYQIHVECIWDHRIVPPDKGWAPYFKVWCNGVLTVDDVGPNSYDMPEGLQQAFGIYVWNWNNLITQSIFARL